MPATRRSSGRPSRPAAGRRLDLRQPPVVRHERELRGLPAEPRGRPRAVRQARGRRRLRALGRGDLPAGYSTYVTEEAVSKPLCGVSRPTHFRGVTTLVAKLINIVGPAHVFVGQKDAQHARRAAQDGGRPELRRGVRGRPDRARGGRPRPPAVRNRDLTPALRQEALSINRALRRPRRWSTPACGARTASSPR
jgi:hypothetical protein